MPSNRSSLELDQPAPGHRTPSEQSLIKEKAGQKLLNRMEKNTSLKLIPNTEENAGAENEEEKEKAE